MNPLTAPLTSFALLLDQLGLSMQDESSLEDERSMEDERPMEDE
jgi:hypothetical protein